MSPRRAWLAASVLCVALVLLGRATPDGPVLLLAIASDLSALGLLSTLLWGWVVYLGRDLASLRAGRPSRLGL